MATIKHTTWLNCMLGDTTGYSVIDIDTDNMDLSLLDQTDSGTITASTANYDTVDAATVVATGDMPSVSSISGGVVTLSGTLTFTSVTGDAADYLTWWKNSGTPSTSPLLVTWDSATTGLPVTPNGGNIVVTWTSNIIVTLS